MNRPYTHDFPAATGRAPTGTNPLEGLSFVFYKMHWAHDLAHWNYPGVLSPYWRFLHCTHGEGIVRYGTVRHRLTAKNLLFIPAGVETDLASDAAPRILYAHFLPLLPGPLETVVELAAPIELPLTDDRRQLIRLLTRPDRRDGFRATDLLRFRALLDLCFATMLEPFLARLQARPPADPRVVRMREWLRQRYAEPVTNATVARAAGLGPDQAVRLYSAATGATPLAHLRRIRIAEASRLLASSELPIKQIAAMCGFANRFHFTRLFAGVTGMGPASFRRRFRPAAPGTGAFPG